MRDLKALPGITIQYWVSLERALSIIGSFTYLVFSRFRFTRGITPSQPRSRAVASRGYALTVSHF